MATRTKGDVSKSVEKVCLELFEKLGVKAGVDVKLEGDGEDRIVRVVIDSSDEQGLLIGKRGSTLLAIQAFLGMAVKQETGEWVRVQVDIGDWREKLEEYLTDIAHQAAQRARETGEEQNLYNLTPSHRRMIHVILADAKGVVTESRGEGEERYLVVKPV